MPQLDFTTYSSQIFWFALCFVALYIAVSKLILPRILHIINNRKNVINQDCSLAEEIENKLNEIQINTDFLLKDAAQKYQQKLEETAKQAAKNREKTIEYLKEKIESMAEKSRQELQHFVEKSQAKSEPVVQDLVKKIKEKLQLI
jgi:F-type H+-transporting ATPase subunit b